MEKDKRSSVDLRQAQREAAEKFAAAKERGDLAAAESALNEFSERMRAFREHWITEALGRNFLGVAAWKNIGVEVGEFPPLPKSLTLELLNSECPLHPGEKIKDTHILVLVPKTVNEEPYCAVKLAELCATRKGAGKKFNWRWSSDDLIFTVDEKWKKQFWARAPQAQSEWVLIPKSDPIPKKMREKYGNKEGSKRHFLRKDVKVQEKVHAEYYTEYREVKTIELMTAVLLYELTHKERLLPRHLRCKERGPLGDPCRVSVSYFSVDLGLIVHANHDFSAFGPDARIGRALARKL